MRQPVVDSIVLPFLNFFPWGLLIFLYFNNIVIEIRSFAVCKKVKQSHYRAGKALSVPGA